MSSRGHTETPPDHATVVVLIPALDEEQALPSVLRALPRDRVDLVLVVDNGSRDATVDVAQALGATVLTEARRGYGSACLAGLRDLAARPDQPTVVAFLDADGSDDPTLLPLLIDPLLSGSADLVLGVRSGDRSAVPIHARLGNGLVLFFVRALFGLRFRDLPPFRAVRYDRLLDLQMDDRDWGWTLQMQIRAGRRKHRIHEVDVPYRRRSAGQSKISGSLLGSVRAGAKMFYTLFRERMRAP